MLLKLKLNKLIIVQIFMVQKYKAVLEICLNNKEIRKLKLMSNK